MFERIGWIMFPRAGIGLPGYAWYYVTCPNCNQRHWNRLVHLEIGSPANFTYRYPPPYPGYLPGYPTYANYPPPVVLQPGPMLYYTTAW